MPSPLHPVDDVLDKILKDITVTSDIKSLGINEALGCYLASDVNSPINVPPAANSEMDGYTFNARDSKMVAGELYEVSDRIPAGKVGKELIPSTLARIFTGAPIPPGADTVVMQENTTEIEGKIRIDELPDARQHVRPKGQDISAGDVILRRGDQLQPEDLGLAASVGLTSLDVFSPLKVAILATGDELVEPGNELAEGQIYNSNRFVLAGLLQKIGVQVIDLGFVKDTASAIRAALERGAKESDCILSTGGVSVGEEDHVKHVVEKLGSLSIWRLAIKPGKPLAYGEVQGTPFFGLPGNPVSVYVTFSIIARPYLIAMQGGNEPHAPYYYGTADFETAAGNRREYIRVRIEPDVSGEIRVRMFENQGSGILSSVSWANGLAEVEIGHHVRPGDRVKFYPL